MSKDNALPSWRDGEAKSAILAFVGSVNEPGETFVPMADRVAAFDNYGTLWCEKPLYVQADFVFRRWKQMVEEDPSKAAQQPWKALVEGALIGSATTLEYRDGAIYRTRGVEMPIDDGPGKPVHIWTRTGRKPLMAGGNADGDVPMLENARFPLLIRHDDAEREFAYDEGAEEAQSEAASRAWTVVSMKDDFETVFLGARAGPRFHAARWAASRETARRGRWMTTGSALACRRTRRGHR